MMKKTILISLLAWVFSVCLVHAQVPSVTLKTMDGKAVNTSDLSNDGKPFIIDFFATWCKPCNGSMRCCSTRTVTSSVRWASRRYLTRLSLTVRVTSSIGITAIPMVLRRNCCACYARW